MFLLQNGENAMKKMKHNKIKNTGILFELLLRQVTADIFSGVDRSKSVGLIKECFNKKTALGQELELYQLLLKSKYNSENKAEYLIEATLKARRHISNPELRKEKYTLIKKIKESFSTKDFFQSRIPNYKVMASIYKMFQTESNSGEFSSTDAVQSKVRVLEHLTNQPDRNTEKSKIKNQLVKKYQEQGKDLRLLSYKILVEKFNEKYSNLNAPQRKLLREYINNVSNTNGLSEYISNEAAKVSKSLKKNVSLITEQVAKIKTDEAINQIKPLLINKNVSIDKKVISLMRYYELVKELKNVQGEK